MLLLPDPAEGSQTAVLDVVHLQKKIVLLCCFALDNQLRKPLHQTEWKRGTLRRDKKTSETIRKILIVRNKRTQKENVIKAALRFLT